MYFFLSQLRAYNLIDIYFQFKTSEVSRILYDCDLQQSTELKTAMAGGSWWSFCTFVQSHKKGKSMMMIMFILYPAGWFDLIQWGQGQRFHRHRAHPGSSPLHLQYGVIFIMMMIILRIMIGTVFHNYPHNNQNPHQVWTSDAEGQLGHLPVRQQISHRLDKKTQ